MGSGSPALLARREHRCGRAISPARSPSCSARRAKVCGRSFAAHATWRSRFHSSATWSRSTSASPPQCSSTRPGGSAVAEPTLYLFDGFNLLHAGGFESPDELRDLLASWVAAKGARGVLVFDGHGADEDHGPLALRWAPDADALIERLAAEHRRREQVAVGALDEA